MGTDVKRTFFRAQEIAAAAHEGMAGMHKQAALEHQYCWHSSTRNGSMKEEGTCGRLLRAEAVVQDLRGPRLCERRQRAQRHLAHPTFTTVKSWH